MSDGCYDGFRIPLKPFIYFFPPDSLGSGLAPEWQKAKWKVANSFAETIFPVWKIMTVIGQQGKGVEDNLKTNLGACWDS